MLLQINALKEARLQALEQGQQLEDGQCEQDAGPRWAPARQQDGAPARCCCGAAAHLVDARLQAADDSCKLQLTKLELLNQMDALQELQWQLDCVVAQLGLGPQGAAGSAEAHGASSSEPAHDPGAASAHNIDYMAMLGKVEELRLAQLQLGECQRRLSRAEGELAAERQRAAAQAQSAAEAYSASQHQASAAAPRPRSSSEVSELGAGGRGLVAELLQDNEELRGQLATAQEQYTALERDYEVELLLKAEAEDAAEAEEDGRGSQPQEALPHIPAEWGLSFGVAIGEAEEAGSTPGGLPQRKRPAQQQPCSQKMERIVRTAASVHRWCMLGGPQAHNPQPTLPVAPHSLDLLAVLPSLPPPGSPAAGGAAAGEGRAAGQAAGGGAAAGVQAD